MKDGLLVVGGILGASQYYCEKGIVAAGTELHTLYFLSNSNIRERLSALILISGLELCNVAILPMTRLAIVDMPANVFRSAETGTNNAGCLRDLTTVWTRAAPP